MTERIIHTLCWGNVPPGNALTLLPDQERFFAVWPAPMIGCACLTRAGVRDFLDDADDVSDDLFAKEWKELLAKSIDILGTYGTARMRKPVEISVVVHNSLFRRLFLLDPYTHAVDLPAIEQLALVTEDDQFGGAIMDFGGDDRVAIHTGYGHRVLYVAVSRQSAFDMHHFVSQLAAGRQITETQLAWEHLLGYGGKHQGIAPPDTVPSHRCDPTLAQGGNPC